MRVPAEFKDHPEPFPASVRRRAVCKHVTDGDTFWALVDFGENIYPLRSYRVRNIDTPELFSGPPEERLRGAAARDYAASLIADQPLRIRTYRDLQSFGRYVADVEYADADGVWRDLADALVGAGHAVRV